MTPSVYVITHARNVSRSHVGSSGEQLSHVTPCTVVTAVEASVYSSGACDHCCSTAVYVYHQRARGEERSERYSIHSETVVALYMYN